MLSDSFAAFFLHELRSVTRRSRFWLLMALSPIITIAAVPKMIWHYHFLGYPLIIFSLYVIPLFVYAPAWRKFQRSPFGDEVYLTKIRNLELLAGFFLPRILLATILFAALYSSILLIPDNERSFFMPTKYYCAHLYDKVLMLPGPVLDQFGFTAIFDSDWRVQFAIPFFLIYLAYNTVVIACVANKCNSFSRIGILYLELTVGIDVVLYCLSIEYWYEIFHLYTGPTLTVMLDWVLVHLSRAWLPWWYFPIKCAIGYQLIRLTVRRLNGPCRTPAV